MKQTTKIVLAIVGVLVVIVIGLAVGARVVIDNMLTDTGGGEPAVELSGNRIERSFDVAGFTDIEIEGGWQVFVTRGEGYDVAVTADEALMEHVVVERQGETLRVDAERWSWSRDGSMRVEVTMPELSGIAVNGGADVAIREMDTEALRIEVAGAGNITGTGSRIGLLEVEVEGAANVDFVESSVVDADIRMSGAGNVELTMAGGELAGVIEGVGSVTYGGEVSRRTITVEGLGSVERR